MDRLQPPQPDPSLLAESQDISNRARWLLAFALFAAPLGMASAIAISHEGGLSEDLYGTIAAALVALTLLPLIAAASAASRSTLALGDIKRRRVWLNTGLLALSLLILLNVGLTIQSLWSDNDEDDSPPVEMPRPHAPAPGPPQAQ